MVSKQKALLEIDAPESCEVCPFRRTSSPNIGGQSSLSITLYCFIASKRIDPDSANAERAEFCPLRIIDPVVVMQIKDILDDCL